MANNQILNKNHFRRWLVLFIIVFLFYSTLAIFSICYPAKDFSIDSSQRLIEAINHSAETKHEYNYVITGPIDINIEDLPVGKNFYGHLIGNGNTINIISEDGRALTSPIFSKIQRGASVERLRVELKANMGEDDNISDITLLANDNFGTIKDCFFSIRNILIGSQCHNASAIVNRNFGEINSVCVNIEDICSTQTRENWQCNFGAVSTTNYSLVKNVFARVSFSKIDIFNKFYDNQSVGYLFSRIGKDVKSTDIDSIFLFGDSSYWDFSVDAERMSKEDVVKNDSPGGSDIPNFVNYRRNRGEREDTVWSDDVDDIGFPKLKTNK